MHSRSYFWIVVLPGTAQSLLYTGEVQQEHFLDSGLARYRSVSEALWCTGEVQQELFLDSGLTRYRSVSEALRCTGEVQRSYFWTVVRQVQISVRGLAVHR